MCGVWYGGGCDLCSVGCCELRTVPCVLCGSDPIPRDAFLGIKLLGCFPRGYFVLLGIRGIFQGGVR